VSTLFDGRLVMEVEGHGERHLAVSRFRFPLGVSGRGKGKRKRRVYPPPGSRTGLDSLVARVGSATRMPHANIRLAITR